MDFSSELKATIAAHHHLVTAPGWSIHHKMIEELISRQKILENKLEMLEARFEEMRRITDVCVQRGWL